MRSSRLVVLALAVTAAAAFTPSTGAAQSPTQGFADSWYWGAYGVFTDFATSVGSSNIRTNAPSIGAEWMLTRKRYALNLFADASYFNTVSSISSPTGAGQVPVNIANMRRVGFALMIFTPEYKMIKPYFSLGYSFNFINSANASCAACTSFATQAAADSNTKAIDDARAMGKPFGNVGFMYIYKRWAPFAQLGVMPTQGKSDWFLNGTGFTTMWAVGLRYNFGASIEKW